MYMYIGKHYTGYITCSVNRWCISTYREVIIDANSVERNRILVSCYYTGGPSERQLPPHYLKVTELYIWCWQMKAIVLNEYNFLVGY